MNRKGISPIIASVLLLAVSLSVVGVFSGWAPQLAQDITDSTENSTMQTIACNEAALEIRSASVDGETVNIALRNSGSEDLTDITLVAYDSSGNILQQNSGISLDSGSIADENITGVTGTAAQVEALSGECGSVTTSADL